MKACIFDLDGVIVDTAKYHFMAWERLARELGISITAADNERLKGVGRLESLDIILEIGGIRLSEEEKVRLAEKKNDWFVEYIQAMKKEELFPGTRELLAELKKRQVKIGLASSSKNAKTVLQKIELEDEFDTVVDGTMITFTKPHPEIFLMTAARLNVAPQFCVVVEDAEAGVAAREAVDGEFARVERAQHHRRRLERGTRWRVDAPGGVAAIVVDHISGRLTRHRERADDAQRARVGSGVRLRGRVGLLLRNVHVCHLKPRNGAGAVALRRRNGSVIGGTMAASAQRQRLT